MTQFILKSDAVFDNRSHRLCVIRRGEIKDGLANRRLAVIKDDVIKDEHSNRIIGKLNGNNILDANGKKLTTISDVRKILKDSDMMDPAYLAAIWIVCLSKY